MTTGTLPYRVCVLCQKPKPASAYSVRSGGRCKPCRAAVRERQRRELQKAGVCTDCGARPRHPESKVHCLECLKKRRARTRRYNGSYPQEVTGLGRPALK